MDYLPICLLFIIHFDRGCLATGVCKDGPTVVATVTQEPFVPGTKDTGFSLTCKVNITDPSYVMSTWRLEGPSSQYIYTFLPPSTFFAGPDYTVRNLNFKNLDTVVFPSYESTDVRKEDLICYLSVNSNSFSCTDIKEQNIFAIPSVTVKSTPELTSGVAVHTEITTDITGTDYMCFKDPTFRVQIGSAPARPLTLTPPPTPGDFSNFTASLKFTATVTESGKINVVMTCGGITATISTDVEVMIAPCNSQQTPDRLGLGVGIGISVMIPVIIVILSLCWLWNRRESKNPKHLIYVCVGIGISVMIPVIIVILSLCWLWNRRESKNPKHANINRNELPLQQNSTTGVQNAYADLTMTESTVNEYEQLQVPPGQSKVYQNV